MSRKSKNISKSKPAHIGKVESKNESKSSIKNYLIQIGSNVKHNKGGSLETDSPIQREIALHKENKSDFDTSFPKMSNILTN